MIYDKTNPPFPGLDCSVFDGRGEEYFQVVRIDTDTGEITSNVTENGYIAVDPHTGRPETTTVKAPLPIRLEPLGPGLHDPRHGVAGWFYRGCICPATARQPLPDCPACTTALRRIATAKAAAAAGG